MGQRDIRRLLIVGAMAVVRAAVRKAPPEGSWLAHMLARKPRMVVAIALANRMARGAWAWAETLGPKAAAISVASYLSRVVDGFERVLTPGVAYDAAAAFADRWAVQSGGEAPRKGKAARIVPASDLDRLGFELRSALWTTAPLHRSHSSTLSRHKVVMAPDGAKPLSSIVVFRICCDA